MVKKYIIALLILGLQSVCADIESPLNGEKDMIKHLRTIVDQQLPEKASGIVIGAGVSGAQAFQQAPEENKKNVLLTWQWLDAIKDMADGTTIVVPIHAVHSSPQFSSVMHRFHFIYIEGVLHTTSKELVMKADSSAIEDINPDMIVMLPGDTQQADGSWKIYTKDMAKEFLTKLPEDKKILFLNGPRTGKYQYDETSNMCLDEDGKPLENRGVHREITDAITQTILDKNNENWTMLDFRYGQTSAWIPALKFLMEHESVPLILAGESTSMISEVMTLGLKSILIAHDVMTTTSYWYLRQLSENNRAFIFPNGLKQETYHQDPTPSQEKEIIQQLHTLTKRS